MKYINIFSILLYFYVRAIRSSNILVFIPSPWKSHILSFQPLFSELVNRGHNLTVVSKFAVQNPSQNYTQIVPSYEFDIDESKINLIFLTFILPFKILFIISVTNYIS